MAVPANPTLQQVCNEYGVPITTPLSSFRRGAGIVPDIPQNAAVPTTLPINLSQLAGSINLAPPNINNQFIDSSTTGAATAGYRLTASGAAQKRVQAAYTTLETWLPAGASAANYGVIATLQSGAALESGTLGSLLQLNADREWVQTRASLGNDTSTLLIQLCSYPAGVVLDSATITLSATRDSA